MLPLLVAYAAAAWTPSLKPPTLHTATKVTLTHNPKMTLAEEQPAPSPPPPLSLGPKQADIALAGLGLCASIGGLGVLQDLLNVKLFAAPMAASGIIFFAGPNPPNPKGFVSGSLASAAITAFIMFVIAQFELLPPGLAVDAISASLLLVWYKSSGAMFPPAAAYCGNLFAVAAAADGGGMGGLPAEVSFLAFPWLAGHSLLYGAALALAPVRQSVRVSLTQGQLRSSLEGLSDEALCAVFSLYDTDDSGGLDADELKVAMKKAIGSELTISECEELIDFADVDGNGVVDVDEFTAIVRGEIAM